MPIFTDAKRKGVVSCRVAIGAMLSILIGRCVVVRVEKRFAPNTIAIAKSKK